MIAQEDAGRRQRCHLAFLTAKKSNLVAFKKSFGSETVSLARRLEFFDIFSIISRRNLLFGILALF